MILRKQVMLLSLLFSCFWLQGISQNNTSSNKTSNNETTNTASASDEKFIIKGTVSQEKLAFYKKSITAADMESYRLKNKEVVLEFEEGFQCVLLSAKQLIIKGHTIDPTIYQEEFDKRFILPVFTILKDGQLIAKYQKAFK